MRFGYDGTGFAGFARQPGKRTVEGEILEGLVRTHAVREGDDPRVRVASRTDGGVHARGNAITLSSGLEGPALLRALNGVAPEIFFTHARVVAEGFSPRAASGRWYRYFEPAAGRDIDRWRAAARLFRGEIDVRSFGRDLPSDAPAIRRVEGVTVRREGPLLTLDVRAPSFVWGMVRKIVSAVRRHDDGRLSLAQLREALDGRLRLTLPLAEADRLVLWDVEYPEPWEYRAPRLTIRQLRRRTEAFEALEVRGAVLAALTEASSGESPVAQ